MTTAAKAGRHFQHAGQAPRPRTVLSNDSVSAGDPGSFRPVRPGGYPLIGGVRPFRDCEFAFVHPKAMNGVLLEVIDYEWRELEDPA